MTVSDTDDAVPLFDADISAGSAVTWTAVSVTACETSATSTRVVWLSVTRMPSRVAGAKPMRRTVTEYGPPTSRPCTW